MQRVWVTGIGVMSAIGCGHAPFCDALAQQVSGVRRFPGQPGRGMPPYVAAAIASLPSGLPAPLLSQLDRSGQLGVQAGVQAWQQAGLPPAASEPERAAIVWGTGMGGAEAIEGAYVEVLTAARPRLHPYTVVRTMTNAAAAQLAIRHGLRGSSLTISNACASSAQAIGEAMRLIRHGAADLVVAGGAESLLVPGAIRAWQAMGVLAKPDEADPAASCRPFDAARGGLVLGEGAAALVLESEAHARARGATPLAELRGYGTSCDATHLSRPDADGQQRAMRQALADAGLQPHEIGYVNAHGTGTDVGDAVEADSLAAVFGPRGVPVSATKGLHGHLMGAGGAVELAACIGALARRELPPSAHVRESDCGDRIDLVLGAARPAPQIRAALSNSFAFGGVNASLIAARLD